jgi:hypothetical protein
LFTTSDNTIGGDASEIASGAVNGRWKDSPYVTTSALVDGGSVLAANIGQELWIEFSTPYNASTAYAFVDAVRLIASSNLVNIVNTGVANCTHESASLRASLDARQSVVTVSAYWSTNNNVGAEWLADDSASSSLMGSYTNVSSLPLVKSVNNLLPSTDYYYTFVASNVAAQTWADRNGSFTTSERPAGTVLILR